ncbi:MAG: response regulator [Candidatus Promineifilaceae bacterium]|nr:response regulator [Candidatus Promineifilaceae bacterium]
MSETVLVVDDEPMARTLLRLMLVRAGFEVVEAEDGFDALEKVQANVADIMILDIMMPGMDGFTVCETVREQHNNDELPILLLSAKTDAESVRKGLACGADLYLTKPISPEELTHHVRSALQARIDDSEPI